MESIIITSSSGSMSRSSGVISSFSKPWTSCWAGWMNLRVHDQAPSACRAGRFPSGPTWFRGFPYVSSGSRPVTPPVDRTPVSPRDRVRSARKGPKPFDGSRLKSRTYSPRSLRSHASMLATNRPVGRSNSATNRPVGRLAYPIPYHTNQSSGKVGAHCIQDGLRLRLSGGPG